MDEHECNDDCDAKSHEANTLVNHVLETMHGKKIQDALDIMGHVSAALQAVCIKKMKAASIESEVVDSWQKWREDLVIAMEEEMGRIKPGEES